LATYRYLLGRGTMVGLILLKFTCWFNCIINVQGWSKVAKNETNNYISLTKIMRKN